MHNQNSHSKSVSPVTRTGVLVILYLILFGYYFSFSEYGLNIWDEGGYANGTLRTWNGERALVDFNPNGYLPGRYLYGILLFKIFGINIQSLRLGIILLTPAMILMVYHSSRKLMSPGFAFLAALCMLSAPSMYYNRFFTFFCVLNLFCLQRVIEERDAPRFFLLFTAILISGFFKFEVALFSMSISLFLLLLMFGVPSVRKTLRKNEGRPSTGDYRYSPLFWGGIGLLVGTLLTLVFYFLKNDLFLKVFELVIEAHRVWGNPFPDLFPFFGLLDKLGPQIMVERSLFYLPIWVYGIVVGLLLARQFKTGKKAIPSNLHVIAVLLFGICSFGLVIWRAGFDNLLRTLPPFYILFCYLLFRVRVRLIRTPVFSNPRNRSQDLFKTTVLNVMMVTLPFLYYYEMNFHQGFYAGSIGALKQETQLVELDRMKIYTNPAEALWIQEVVDRIQTYSRKGDPIFVLPLNPIFYFLTDRINPTPYDWILPGMLKTEDELDVIERLKKNMPKMVVFVDIPIDGKEERRLSRYAPEIYNFLSTHYVFEEIIGFFQILLPKEYYQS